LISKAPKKKKKDERRREKKRKNVWEVLACVVSRVKWVKMPEVISDFTAYGSWASAMHAELRSNAEELPLPGSGLATLSSP
jgi:hypothetical protein